MTIHNMLTSLKQKKYFSLIIVIFLVLFIVVFIAALFGSRSNQQTEITISPTPSTISPSAFPSQSAEGYFDLKKQDQKELEFSKEQEGMIQNYPWLNKLPLQTENYFVYFDVEKKAFVGILYPSGSDPSLVNSQVAETKARINKELTDLGVNVAKYKFEWDIQLGKKAN